MKRGVFFSTDALVALTIILFVIILAYPTIKKQEFGTEVHYDVLQTLGTLEVQDVQNPTIQNLIATGQLQSSNETLVETLGQLYITNLSLAQTVATALLDDITTNENIGIWYDTTLIASKNRTSIENAREVKASRQILSGIKAGENVTGISARALLGSSSQTAYTYFGGYIGDGNLTFTIQYNGTITRADLEIAINKGFDLYINNKSSGHYAASPNDLTPINYTLPIANFTSGLNTVSFRAPGAYVAGGYIKISHDTEALYPQTSRYYFPGINGVINLYDGLYVPGTLQSMSIRLHLNSSQKSFLTIGNVTIENANSGTTDIFFTDGELRNLLNYNSLSNHTTPIRVGLENVSFIQNATSNADVILITDLSGSMDWRLDSDTNGVTRACNDPQLTSASTRRISLAKCIDQNFIGTILGNGSNRVGLVGFSTDADNSQALTNNRTLLNATVGAYATSGATCISCAINLAYEMLESQGVAGRPQYIIVMTDGVSNVRSTNTCADFFAAGSNSTRTQAGGINGLLAQRTTQWNEFPPVQSGSINDIEFNRTRGLAVGNNGRIVLWNGTSWTNMTSPVTSALYGVDMLNDTFAIAVGASGKVLKWTGGSWTTAATITNSPTLNDISIVNSTLMYAAGQATNGRIYRSINGGMSWTQVYGSGTNWRGLEIINETFGFAVGTNGEIVRLSGTTWNTMTSPTTQTLYRVKRINSTTTEAVGGNNGNSVIIQYRNNAWASVTSVAGDSLRDIAIQGSSLYALGEGGTVFEAPSGSWTKTFNVPMAYQGNNTDGLTCTTDQDSCSETDSYPALNAEYSACRANEDLGATVFSVGFGPIASCSFASQTLQAIATCGNGTYYASSNATALQQFYSTIAQTITHLSYVEQTSILEGNITTTLYPDSYIEYSYQTPPHSYGLLITQEKQFDSNGLLNFTIPSGASLIEARVTSYSGSKWTKELLANNQVAYNLTSFNKTSYERLGDPFVLNIPNALINNSNTLRLRIGTGPVNETAGSSSDKLILTTLRNASGYSPIASVSDGCIWNIDFEDGTNITTRIPSTYIGSNQCYYQQALQAYNINDAAQSAIFLLLRSLDAEPNNKVDTRFSSQDVTINLTTIQGIPYSWSTEVQVRAWR